MAHAAGTALHVDPLVELDDWLAPYRWMWESRLDRLGAHLDAMPDDEGDARCPLTTSSRDRRTTDRPRRAPLPAPDREGVASRHHARAPRPVVPEPGRGRTAARRGDELQRLRGRSERRRHRSRPSTPPRRLAFTWGDRPADVRAGARRRRHDASPSRTRSTTATARRASPPGGSRCLAGLRSVLAGEPLPPPDRGIARHEQLVHEFGLDRPEVTEADGRWTVRVERQLTCPAEVAWDLWFGKDRDTGEQRVAPAVGEPLTPYMAPDVVIGTMTEVDTPPRAGVRRRARPADPASTSASSSPTAPATGRGSRSPSPAPTPVSGTQPPRCGAPGPSDISPRRPPSGRWRSRSRPDPAASHARRFYRAPTARSLSNARVRSASSPVANSPAAKSVTPMCGELLDLLAHCRFLAHDGDVRRDRRRLRGRASPCTRATCRRRRTPWRPGPAPRPRRR